MQVNVGASISDEGDSRVDRELGGLGLSHRYLFEVSSTSSIGFEFCAAVGYISHCALKNMALSLVKKMYTNTKGVCFYMGR